LIYSCISFVEH